MSRTPTLVFAVMPMLAFGLLSTAKASSQPDLQTILVAGVGQATAAPTTSQTVYESTVTYDATYLALAVSEATAGAGPVEFIPAPTRTEVRTWRAGSQYRIEIDAIGDDGTRTPSAAFICNSLGGLRYTSDVPESLKPGIAETLSPELLARHVSARGWEDFFHAKPKLPLVDAESQGYTLRLDSTEPAELLGYGAFALGLEKNGARITMHIAPQCGFLPLKRTIHNSLGQLVTEAEVLSVADFGGKILPTQWVSRHYQGSAVVSTTEIRVISAVFDQPIDNAVFQHQIPEGFRLRKVNR